jgi:acetyltransferase-like isoleucine patch superfamily enzyme
MIRVGRGSTISFQARLCGYRLEDDAVVVAPVEIGRNVFVGADVDIGPGTKVGDGCWIGLGNALAGEELAAESRLEDYARSR